MKPFFALALCLSLINTFATARIPHSYRQLQERDDESQSPNAVLNWLNRLFRRQQDVCYQDPYYDFVNNSTFGQNFCRVLGIQYPNKTVVEEFTPIVTITQVRTEVDTQNVLVRTTPVTTKTVTVTGNQVGKRDAQITPIPRDTSFAQKTEYINAFRRQADNSTELPPDDNVIASSLSSACGCQGYIGSTITQTYTNQPNFLTLLGFARSATTVYTTRIDREITSTVTVTKAAEPTSAAISTGGPIVYSPVPEPSATAESSAEGSMVVQTTGVPQGTPSTPKPSTTQDTPPEQPDPTAPPFTCPDDNGMTISQMLGSERFDYDVYCDTDITSASIPIDLSYNTFSECVAACSLANMQFAQPVCQGAAYFETTGNNCFLKSTANATDTAAKLGVDLVILKRVAVGISPENNEGTSTEVVAFSEETPNLNPSEVGSLISEMLGSGTSTVPILVPEITPPPGPIISGRPAMDGITAYSTFISNGETVSTGSAYSLYFSNSSNGSWFYTYYSEWSLAWTDVQTVYGAGETFAPVAAKDNSTTVIYSENDGGRSDISNVTTAIISHEEGYDVYNITELIGNTTYNANGVQIFATTTTNYYTYTVAADNGSGGGMGGGGAGVITSTGVSSFSTQTVIYSSGNTGGSNGGQGSRGQVIQTPGPAIPSASALSTQLVNTSVGGAAGSQGGQGGGGGGGGGGSASGTAPGEVVTSTVPTAGGSSVIFVTGGTAFSTGGVISGVVSINGTSGATSAVGSGAVVKTPTTSTLTNISVILSSGGTGGVFSTGAQGVGTGSTASGAVITSPSSSRGSFSNTGALRTPKPGDSDYIPPTESPSGPAPYSPASATPSGSIPSLNGSIPIPTGASFTNSQTLRNGDFSTTSGPAPYPPLSSSPIGSSILTVNASLPILSFTNSQTLRTGLQTTSPGGPVPYPPRSTTPSRNASLPIPTGTSPGTAPISPLSTSPSGAIPPLNVSLPVPTGTAPSTIQTLSVPMGTGSSTGTFTNTNRPRSGTLSTSSAGVTSRPPVVQTLPVPSQRLSLSTGGSSMALSTGIPSNGTFPPFPTGTAPPATSCPPMAVSTTTLWATTTQFGCYDFCPPSRGGFYGPGSGPPGAGGPPIAGDRYQGPRSFGLPAAIFAPTLVSNPNPEPTEATSPA